LGIATAFRDAIDAGVETGARIVVSGPPFYPASAGIAVTTDFLWVPTNAAEADRGLALLAGFGAGHAKMRYVQSWHGGAEFVRVANQHGLRVSSHCAHGLSVVLAGITGHEHTDGQCGEWEFGIRDDITQLYARAGVTVAPVIDLHADYARRNDQIPAAARARLQRRTDRARVHAQRLSAAGVRIVTGSDAQDSPGGIHRELQQLVAAGLSTRAALAAATRNAADAIGLGETIGQVKTGYLADLVILDADPLADISNTRLVWMVIQAGRIVKTPSR
ncbi:MAG TPA: amidohydrolase family protein, partial [Longimicrobiales bacterium]|nr:amidohydrolase family protein [Longimicrobiales bacterium]